MSEEVRDLRERLVNRVRQGPGRSSPEARCAAFDNRGVDQRARALVDKATRHAWRITDADVAATKAAGMTEDEIFELVVCAAIGQATRQLNAGLAALDAAAGAEGADPPGSARSEGASHEA